MVFEKYKLFINSYVSMPFIEWQLLKSKLFVEHFKKGETILFIGDSCSQLRFINTGLARVGLVLLL